MDASNIDTIYNADCMEHICDIEDESVDLAILDPNYNDWDYLIKNGLIPKVKRKIKRTGNIICFTKQPFDFNLRCEIDHIFRREIVWTFSNGGAWVSNRMPLVSHQYIYWCTLSNDFYFNCRTGLPYSEQTRNFKRKNKVFGDYNEDGRQFNKSTDGVWIRDHLHFNKPNSGKVPAKPKELIEILIRCFCPNDGLILDPFVGSGVIEQVAKQQEKHFIGYEIDKNNYNNALKKIISE